MGYEPDQVHRTLILHKRTVSGRKVYSFGRHMLITEANGANYFEQVPYEGLMDGSRDVYLFDEIMILDSPGPDHSANANMHHLSADMGDNFAVRNRA